MSDADIISATIKEGKEQGISAASVTVWNFRVLTIL
jgi:hypothetical protein